MKYVVNFSRREVGSAIVDAISPEEAKLKGMAVYDAGDVDWNKEEMEIEGVCEDE